MLARRVVFIALAAGALVLPVPPWVALVAGIAFGLLAAPHPFGAQAKSIATTLLQVSVVGLGAGMNLEVVLRVGAAGALQTVATLAGTLALTALVAKLLGTERVTSALIGVGTGICGGSAIAAVAPVIGAKPNQTSVALAVVFLLNGVALLIFPAVGRAVGMGEEAFGLWSALAIHDTSSVVGASASFGETALRVGTTVKLARSLWIVPLTLIAARVARSPTGTTGSKKPWFIAGFLLMAAVMTWLPQLRPIGEALVVVARHTLVLTLFLIGSSVNREALASVGARPLVLGVIVWVAVAALTLLAIQQGVLTP
jgi:uncharacterized integral membrane protein (TIGR00698 family)